VPAKVAPAPIATSERPGCLGTLFGFGKK
jgi:hypothetical protein